MATDPGALGPTALAFLAARGLASLTLLRRDGSPHVTPVGFTWDPDSHPAFGLAPDDSAVVPAAQGDTWFNHTYYNAPQIGSFAYACGILHEMGHALGLKHGHMTQDVRDANGNILHINNH